MAYMPPGGNTLHDADQISLSDGSGQDNETDQVHSEKPRIDGGVRLNEEIQGENIGGP
jgi:hypothetical protein